MKNVKQKKCSKHRPESAQSSMQYEKINSSNHISNIVLSAYFHILSQYVVMLYLYL